MPSLSDRIFGWNYLIGIVMPPDAYTPRFYIRIEHRFGVQTATFYFDDEIERKKLTFRSNCQMETK